MAKAGAGNKGAANAADESDDPRTQRSRWATRKLTQKSSGVKRLSIMDRIGHKRTASTEKKRQSGGSNSLPLGDGDTHDDEDDDQNPPPADAGSTTSGDEGDGRVLYFNLPLPDEFKDEDGHPKQNYTRNKIRTVQFSTRLGRCLSMIAASGTLVKPTTTRGAGNCVLSWGVRRRRDGRRGGWFDDRQRG